jgi:hypothetical protein
MTKASGRTKAFRTGRESDWPTGDLQDVPARSEPSGFSSPCEPGDCTSVSSTAQNPARVAPQGRLPFCLAGTPEATREQFSDLPGYAEIQDGELFPFGHGLSY